MFDTLADVPPLLVALSLVSTTLLGVALAAKPTTQPRAAPLASTVDTVASADHAGSETRAIDADAIRLTRHAIEVRDGADTSRETYAYGPVAPSDATRYSGASSTERPRTTRSTTSAPSSAHSPTPAPTTRRGVGTASS